VPSAKLELEISIGGDSSEELLGAAPLLLELGQNSTIVPAASQMFCRTSMQFWSKRQNTLPSVKLELEPSSSSKLELEVSIGGDSSEELLGSSSPLLELGQYGTGIPIAASQVLCETSMQFEPITQSTVLGSSAELELGSSLPEELLEQLARITARIKAGRINGLTNFFIVDPLFK
jgi:hypothetical protein